MTTVMHREELATLNQTIATAITRHFKQVAGYERMAESNQLLAIARDYFREQGEGDDMIARIHVFNVEAGDDPEESYEVLPEQAQALAEKLWDVVSDMGFLDSSEMREHIAEAFLTGLKVHLDDMLEYADNIMMGKLVTLLSCLTNAISDQQKKAYWNGRILSAIAGIMRWDTDAAKKIAWVMNRVAYATDGAEDYIE